MTLPPGSAPGIEDLKAENLILRQRLALLEQEVLFLKTHPAISQGLKGETLVAKLVGGSLTAFAAEHDVTVGSEITIEVKFSKLNIPALRGSTRRWNWSKPLGWKDKGKAFDFLLLVGDKDPRFAAQYLDDSPYVFFLIPHARVPKIMSSGATVGGNVQIITNLNKTRSATAGVLKGHMVSERFIVDLFSQVCSLNTRS